MIDYHNKVFIGIDHVGNRDFTNETVFYCKQYGAIVQGKYYGGKVKYGELIGLVNEEGILQASFNHFNTSADFYGGVCTLTPEKSMPLRLQAKWCWADVQKSESVSTMEEMLQISTAFPC